MPPFLAILVCTTVAARWRMTSSNVCSVDTDSSTMIGIAVARLKAASPARSQIATGCSATSMSYGSSFFRSWSAASYERAAFASTRRTILSPKRSRRATTFFTSTDGSLPIFSPKWR